MSREETVKYKYKSGKQMTAIELADSAGIDPLNKAEVQKLVNILLRRGDITVVDTRNKEEKAIDSAMEEHLFQSTIDIMDAQEQAHKEYVRNQKLQETSSHTFDLQFVTSLEATKFETWVNSLGIRNTAQIPDTETGAIKLFIKEVSPQEYTKITTRYLAESKINGAMQATGKALNGATNAVNYGLSEIVAPTAKLAGEAGMNLAKGLFHTFIKTGAGLVNSTAKAVEDTKYAVSTDAECLRAMNQLIDAKNGIRRGVASKVGVSAVGNGITNY